MLYIPFIISKYYMKYYMLHENTSPHEVPQMKQFVHEVSSVLNRFFILLYILIFPHLD